MLLWLITGFVLASCTPYAQTGPPANGMTATTAVAKGSSANATAPQSNENTDSQAIFEAEGEIRRPVAVPDDVLQILREDERNQRSLAQGQTPSDMPASWFVGSRINLNNDDLPDLVVMAANPRLLGANIVPFWIFRHTQQGHKLALHAMTLGLEVMKAKTSGYRNIRTTEVVAGEVLDTVYVFNGREYHVARRTKERIKE